MRFKPSLWDGTDPSYAPCIAKVRNSFYWRAPKKYKDEGYSAGNVSLPGSEGDGREHERARICRDHTREMLRWYESGRAKVDPGTWQWLIARYKSDEYSPIQNIKANTRASYLHSLAIWEAAIGKVTLTETDYVAIMRWQKAMKDKGRSTDFISRQFRHLRIVARYGALIRADGADQVMQVLSNIRVKTTKPRTVSPTEAHINAVIAAADAAGDTSFALGMCLQWWLTLRAVDVRGQFLGKGGQKRWADGLTWDMVARDLSQITKTPSKTETSMPEVIVWSLEHLADIKQRLSAIPADQRVGPVIKQQNGQPFSQNLWSNKFRKYADLAGIPKEIWGMDIRAAAINHAKRSGASKIAMQHQANHANPTTTDRYIRERSDSVNSVIALRTKSQHG